MAALLLFYYLKRGRNTENNLTPTAKQAIQAEIKSPDLWPYVFAQWQFESANFKSDLVRRASNASGMRIASRRPQVRDGESNNYAVYKDLKQCAEDLQLWLTYTKFPNSVSGVSEYCAEMKRRGYFTADLNTYTKGVAYYYERNKRPI